MDATIWKERFRGALDALPLDPGEREALVEEARHAFRLHVELFSELGEVAGTPGRGRLRGHLRRVAGSSPSTGSAAIWRVKGCGPAGGRLKAIQHPGSPRGESPRLYHLRHRQGRRW